MATQSNPLNLVTHLHTYERVRSKPKTYRCIHPDCTHTTPKELLLGKRAECYVCHKPFIIDAPLIRKAKIHCHACTGNVKRSNKGCYGFDPQQPGLQYPAMSREELIKSLRQSSEQNLKGKH